MADRTSELAAHAARRAAEAHPGASLDQLLAELVPGNDLTTLLLHAFRQRARRRDFAAVLALAARTPMTHASAADPRRVHAFESHAFAAAAAFDAVDLSPVVPHGLAGCAGVDPNNVLATLRGGEVCGDPTTALAVHAARLRGAGRDGTLRLCASQRVMRTQPVAPPFTPHFRLFALATANRADGRADAPAREHAALLEHLTVWAALVARLGAAGYRTAGLAVRLSDTMLTRAALRARGVDPEPLIREARAHLPGSTERALERAAVDVPRHAPEAAAAAAELGLDDAMRERARLLDAAVVAPLRRAHPEVEVSVDLARLQGVGYYVGPYVQLVVRRDDGESFTLGDGGALPWLGAMRSDRRERLVATGLAPEPIAALFAPPAPPP